MPLGIAQALGILRMGRDVPPDLAGEPPPAQRSSIQHQGGPPSGRSSGCCSRAGYDPTCLHVHFHVQPCLKPVRLAVQGRPTTQLHQTEKSHPQTQPLRATS